MRKTIKAVTIIFFAILVLLGAIFFIKKYFGKNKQAVINLGREESLMPQESSEKVAGNELADKTAETDIVLEENKTAENNIPPKENNLPARNVFVEPANAENKNLKIIDKLVSWGFAKGSANRLVDTIIIHSSYDALSGNEYDVSGLIKEYKSYGVAPHYLIDRAGMIYRLVEEKNIAYHAGEGKTPDGRSGVNNFSLGIEMMNSKTDKLTTEQYVALNKLIQNIKSRYEIKYVLGHKQIAPGRKDDPWNFDWKMIK